MPSCHLSILGKEEPCCSCCSESEAVSDLPAEIPSSLSSLFSSLSMAEEQRSPWLASLAALLSPAGAEASCPQTGMALRLCQQFSSACAAKKSWAAFQLTMR